MMATREPFVSGLAGDLRSPVASPEHREGMRKLDAIRALALDRIEANRPQAQNRFDGVERQQANPVAIAEIETDCDIVRLIELLLGDEALKTKVTERLGRAGR